nr:hypothetical protein [Tanacetum cinerariifolium]
MLFYENRINPNPVANYTMRVPNPSLGKITVDIFLMERRTSWSTNQFYWRFIYTKFFSRNFIDTNFFSNTLHTSNLLWGIIKQYRVLKLQALA